MKNKFTKRRLIRKKSGKRGGGIFSRYSSRKTYNEKLKDELGITNQKINTDNVDKFMAYFKEKQFDPNANSSKYGWYWKNQCDEINKIVKVNLENLSKFGDDNREDLGNKIKIIKKIENFILSIRNRKNAGKMSMIYNCLNNITNDIINPTLDYINTTLRELPEEEEDKEEEEEEEEGPNFGISGEGGRKSRKKRFRHKKISRKRRHY